MRELLLANGIDPATFYQDAEMSSRFVDAHQDISFAGETISSHIHPFHELVYCISGPMDYLVGSEQYHLQQGDILSIPAGISHAPLIPESMAEPYRRYVLWLSQEFVQMTASLLSNDIQHTRFSRHLIHTSGTAREHLSQYFRRCVQECEQRQYRWETAVFGIATDLAVQLVRILHSSQDGEPGKPEMLDQILSYVENHLAERITVADIAARFWVSQSTVSQLFRKKMGTSLYRYVTQRRLAESKLLIKSGLPMDQVSISVGFSDYSTFYRAFKAEFGQSPAQFRKEQ